jgi:hypothetical protein
LDDEAGARAEGARTALDGTRRAVACGRDGAEDGTVVEVTGLTTRVSFDPASFLHSLLVEFELGTKAERR